MTLQLGRYLKKQNSNLKKINLFEEVKTWP